MNKTAVIQKTAAYVRRELGGEATGHDWYHIERVWKMARRISKTEKVDRFVVEVAALLHDIADWKFSGDEYASARLARRWLKRHGADEKTIQHVEHIINNLSFKGAKTKGLKLSREGQVVQDADRLDALGAIGIGRAFAYGGHKGRMMYDPTIKPIFHTSMKHYRKAQSTTINHFYEKLLLLRGRLNTRTARRIAGPRHRFMQEFVRRFLKEWDGHE